MRDTIQIGNTQVEMAANAASPFLYRKTFGEDFLLKLYEDGNTLNDKIALFEKMAYIMMMQAKAETGEIDRKALYSMRESDCIDWLMGLDDPMAIANAISDLAGLYFKTNLSTSVKKTKGAGRSARTRQGSTSSDAQN